MPSRSSIRCYGARRLNLNAAPIDALRDNGLNAKRATRLVQHRPYRSWDEIEQVPGFDKYVVFGLQENSYLGPSLRHQQKFGMLQHPDPKERNPKTVNRSEDR